MSQLGGPQIEPTGKVKRLRAEIERLRADLVAADNTARINLQGCKDCMIEIERLRAALKTLEELGRHGMKPDYTEWLTFHDKVAQIAAAALNQQATEKEK